MFKKFRHSLLAVLATVALTAGISGGCAKESETIKIPYVEWA